jgi:hypothetical protein
MSTLDSNKVTGVSVVSNATDAANKSYIDTLDYNYASPSGNSGKFLSGYPGLINWAIRTTVDYVGSADYGNALAYGNGTYVGGAGDGIYSIQTSTDTINWTLRTSGFINRILAVTYANGIFVAGGFSGILNTSTNAIVWTLRTTVINGSENLSLTSLNGTYIIGSVGGVLASTNAIVWKLRTCGLSTPSTQIYAVGAGGNLILAGGQSNSGISVSTDSINWTLRTSGIVSQTIRSISYGNGIYLASGSLGGTLISSTDTISWTLRTSSIGNTIFSSPNKIQSIIYANSTYIICGETGSICTSTDSITWSPRSTNITFSLYALTYGNDIVVAGGLSASSVITSRLPSQFWQSINSSTTTSTDPSYKGYQEFTTSGTQTYYVPLSATQFYIEAIGGGGGGTTGKLTPSAFSGGGGGGGAYNSWLIRRGELGNSSTITVTTGAKGIGGSAPTSGGNTSLTWTGNSTSGTITYTLTSLGGSGANGLIGGGTGASAAASILNPLYGTPGSSGAAGNTSFNLSNNNTQSQQFQVTGGGGGGFINNDGGYSRTYYYGNIFTAAGGVSGADGENGIGGSYTGSYGSGGAGGGALFTGFSNWQQKASKFGSTSINSISGDATPIYISVGNSGTLTTSTNSHDWTLRTSGFGATNIDNIIVGNEYVASGDFGRLTASTDAISWRLRTSGFGTTNINALTYFNNEYLIGGRVETVSWTFRTSGNLSNIFSSYFASNTFILGYDQGSLITSTNSVEWSSRTSGFGSSSINGITFFNNEFLIGGRKEFGQSWTLRTSGFGTTGIAQLLYTSVSGDLYVALGRDTGGLGLSASRLSVSTDTIAWTLRTTGISTPTLASAVVEMDYFNNEYLIAGRINTITWNLRTSTLNLNNTVSVSATTYSNGEFLVGGQFNTISWTLRTAAFSTSNFISSAFGGPSNLFLLGTDNGVLQVSTDGISWVLRTSGFGTSRIDSISYSDGITPAFYIISGGAGKLATSTNSIEWTLRTSGFGTTTIFTVFSGAGFCVAGGASSGRVSVSTNGVQWALRTISSTTFSPLDGTYILGPGSTNNYFLTGPNPGVRHSTDTINWSLRTVGTIVQIGQVGADRAIAFGNSVYVLGTITGGVFTSTNSIQWTIRTVPSFIGSVTTSISFGNGNFILNGSLGYTASSTNAIVWSSRTSGFGTSSINTSAYDDTTGRCIISGSGIACSGTSDSITTQGKGALLIASTDTVNWVIRTTISGYETILSSSSGTTFTGGNSNGAITLVSTYTTGFNYGMIASTDNINWVLRTVGFLPSTVGYANNLYFAGTSNGTTSIIATSTNAIEWTLRTVGSILVSPNTPTVYGYGNGIYFSSFGSNSPPWLATSTDAISWVIRTLGVASAAFISIQSASYGNSNGSTPTYLVGTTRGVPGIASSTDCIAWTIRTTGLSTAPRDIKFNNVHVITTASAQSATSTDGIMWTIRTTGFELLSNGVGLAQNNNLWLSVYSTLQIQGSTEVTISQLGNGAFLRASTDTISWVTRSTAPNVVDIQALGKGPSYVLASGANYWNSLSPFNLMASTDNITWTLRTTGGGGNYILSIAYSDVNNLYVISGAASVATRVSTDTIHWVSRTTGAPGQVGNLGAGPSFIYANNIYIYGNIGGSMVTSTNSIEWSLRTSGFGASNITTITWANSAFIAGSVGGTTATSTDGIMWTLRTSGFGTSNILSSAFGNGRSLLGGNGGTLVASTQDFSTIIGGALLRSSTNGVQWTTRNLDTTSFDVKTLGSSDSFAVAAGDDVTSGGFINVSANNINWTARTSVPGVTVYSGAFAYGSPYYLLGTSNIPLSCLIASTDTIAWTIRTVPSVFATAALSYGNSLYLLVGDSGKLATSTNSIQWTLRTSGMGSGFEASTGVNYNSGIFVASSGLSSGLTSVSTDAITWIARTTGFGVSKIDTISVGNNIWIISGEGGTIQSSTQETLSQLGNGAFLRASTNSIAWITRTTGKDAVQIIQLQSGDQGNANGQYSLASGLNYIGQNFLIASTDNINWIARTSGFGSSILSLGYGDGIYLIGGNSGALLTTTNTINWRFRTSGFGSSSIISLIYGSGYYVAASATNVAYSTNAIHWQIRDPGFGSSSINALTFQNDRYLAAGTGGSLAVSYAGLDAISAGKGGNGTRGGGGGGGAVVNVGVGSFGHGGDGGDGYVKITWW